MKITFMNIINLDSTDGFSPYEFSPRFHGFDKEVAKNFSAKLLGFHLEILDPGCFSSPYHYHEQEEELVIVLEGEATLRQNNQFRKIFAHDLVFFPTGPEFVHQIYNHSQKPFRYFVLSNKSKSDICHYLDSNKKLIVNSGKVESENGNAVDYWKDELDPTIYWLKDKL